MKGLLSVFAVTAVLAGPAAAQTMSCAKFASLSEAEKIAEIERLEPKSVEEKGSNTADSAQASSGAAGTVDPQMLEAEKVDAVMAACDATPNATTAEAMEAAFNKPK